MSTPSTSLKNPDFMNMQMFSFQKFNCWTQDVSYFNETGPRLVSKPVVMSLNHARRYKP